MKAPFAEHAVSLQFRYFPELKGRKRKRCTARCSINNSQELVETRQVEVTLTVGTPQASSNGPSARLRCFNCQRYFH